MFKLSVLDGPQVDLGQMLAAKDARMTKEYDWLKANPDTTLLHVTLRIPGPVKTGKRVVTSLAGSITTKRARHANRIVTNWP